MSSCQEHKHGHDGHDPTMDSCCERDLAEQAQAQRHLERLRAVDPSTTRSSMSAAVLGTPVSTASPEYNQHPAGWDSMEDSDEDNAGRS